MKSLNRTMQYGNGLLAKNPALTAMFKSYYVVWKRILKGFLYLGLEQFKSYYVVWKLIFFENENIRPQCLNRTMQYGNFFSLWWVLMCAFCLNRTMQYGNSQHI